MSGARKGPAFRVFPVAIVVAVLLLSVKLGDVWQAVSAGRAPVTMTVAAVAEESKITEEPSASTEDAMADAGAEDEHADAGAEDEPAPTDPEGMTISSLSPGDLELLQQLAERRRQIEAHERDLDTREKALALAEERLSAKLEELKALKAEVEALVTERDEVQEAQLASLVKIYENMKPKDAAPIFDQLDMPILLDVIERMKEAKVAPILALMTPDRAKQVTQDLAIRREMPPPGG